MLIVGLGLGGAGGGGDGVTAGDPHATTNTQAREANVNFTRFDDPTSRPDRAVTAATRRAL